MYFNKNKLVFLPDDVNIKKMSVVSVVFMAVWFSLILLGPNWE